MGHADFSSVGYVLPDGRPLLRDVSFRVGDGARVALVGPNGAGKTTLLRIAAGELSATAGSVVTSGGVGVMPQFVGSIDDGRTVRDLLVSLSPLPVRAADAGLAAAEIALMSDDSSQRQMRYATALAEWGEVGGYEEEVRWDMVCTAALGESLDSVKYREVQTLSGGEQKRLVLEALLRGPEQVLLLDEPDNFLDVPGKLWLEDAMLGTDKTLLYVSHDRELLARTATIVVTVEGGAAWVHGGGFDTYPAARAARFDRLDELHRRWTDERDRLRETLRTLQQQAARSPDMASRYKAMQSRVARFEADGPPPQRPPEQNLRMRITGGRTGVRVLTAEQLALTGLTDAFDLELFYGDRVAILGANGTGKSHFLRLIAGESVAHTGRLTLGARVVPGYFVQTHGRPELAGATLLEILADHRLDRSAAMGRLRRYELHGQADQRLDQLSGGQQARVQILLLELSGATLLVLDEPTDNLDIESADALQAALDAFDGTVVAVTHDRYFARSFSRFVVFTGTGAVTESTEPVWEVTGRGRRSP